jgi:hypothetical protein
MLQVVRTAIKVEGCVGCGGGVRPRQAVRAASALRLPDPVSLTALGVCSKAPRPNQLPLRRRVAAPPAQAMPNAEQPLASGESAPPDVDQEEPVASVCEGSSRTRRTSSRCHGRSSAKLSV